MCRERFRQVGETLGCLREYPLPERNEAYGGEVWNRLAPRLPAAKERKLRPAWLRNWMLAPVLAGSLLAVFLAGVWTGYTRIQSSEKAHERVLLSAMSDHLERSEIVLAELVNASPESLDWLRERERARNLLDKNRLLRQTALHLGNRPQAALLDDLERVLLDLANSPAEASSADLKILQQRVENDWLLWKVRIVSTNAREKGQKL